MPIWMTWCRGPDETLTFDWLFSTLLAPPSFVIGHSLHADFSQGDYRERGGDRWRGHGQSIDRSVRQKEKGVFE